MTCASRYVGNGGSHCGLRDVGHGVCNGVICGYVTGCVRVRYGALRWCVTVSYGGALRLCVTMRYFDALRRCVTVRYGALRCVTLTRYGCALRCVTGM